MQPLRRLSMLFACAGALQLACVTVAVGAQPEHGKLTRVEYTQLRTAFAALKADTEHKPPELSAMDSACRAITNATQLLTVSREDCTGQLGFLAISDEITTLAAACSDESTTALRDHCLLPIYKRFATAAVTMHQDDAEAAQVARRRGFGSECVAVLADPPAVIADELSISYSSEDIVDDLQAGAKTDLVTDTGRLARAEKRLEQDAKAAPMSVSICPHKPALPGSGSGTVGIAA